MNKDAGSFLRAQKQHPYHTVERANRFAPHRQTLSVIGMLLLSILATSCTKKPGVEPEPDRTDVVSELTRPTSRPSHVAASVEATPEESPDPEPSPSASEQEAPRPQRPASPREDRREIARQEALESSTEESDVVSGSTGAVEVETEVSDTEPNANGRKSPREASSPHGDRPPGADTTKNPADASPGPQDSRKIPPAAAAAGISQESPPRPTSRPVGHTAVEAGKAAMKLGSGPVSRRRPVTRATTRPKAESRRPVPRRWRKTGKIDLEAIPRVPELPRMRFKPRGTAAPTTVPASRPVSAVGTWQQVAGGQSADFCPGGYASSVLRFRIDGLLEITRTFGKDAAISQTWRIGYAWADNRTALVLGKDPKRRPPLVSRKGFAIRSMDIVATPATERFPVTLRCVHRNVKRLRLGAKEYRRVN